MTQTDWRKRELEDLADFIATENGNDRLPVDVAAIAEENGITMNCDTTAPRRSMICFSLSPRVLWFDT